MLKISLIPAATMIVAKVLGLYTAFSTYNINFSIGNEVQDLFSVQILVPGYENTLLVNSLSDLILLAVMVGVNVYLFFKYFIHNKADSDPRTIVKITRLNLVKWITDKEGVFLKVFIWVTFLLATCAIIVTSSLRGNTYSWIGSSAFVVAIMFMWGLVRAFEIEIAKVYPQEKYI